MSLDPFAFQIKVGKHGEENCHTCLSYLCNKILYDYYIWHLHSYVSSTDGEWSVAISLEMGSDAIILPVSCY